MGRWLIPRSSPRSGRAVRPRGEYTVKPNHAFLGMGLRSLRRAHGIGAQT